MDEISHSHENKLIGYSMLYHDIMINLCQTIATDASLIGANPPFHNPLSSLVHSKVCYETVIRLYYLRHSFSYSDSYMTHTLALLAQLTQQKLNFVSQKMPPPPEYDVEETRATLILAAQGLHDLGKNYRFPYTIFMVILNQTSPVEAALMQRFVNIRKEDIDAEQVRTRHVQSHYPMNIVNFVKHPKHQRLSHLIKLCASAAPSTWSPTLSSDDSGLT